MKTKDVYIKYENYAGSVYREKLGGYSFEDGQDITDFGEKDIPEGKIRVLLCKCGSNNWTDNGRNINEYECDCCGQFVTAYPVSKSSSFIK